MGDKIRRLMEAGCFLEADKMVQWRSEKIIGNTFAGIDRLDEEGRADRVPKVWDLFSTT